MRQLIFFLLIVFALGASGWGYWTHRDDPAAAPDAAAFTYASVRLEEAGKRLGELHAVLGSYAGIDPALFVGMTIAYADDARYCLQIPHEGAWYRLAGPGGSPDRGACA